MPRKKPDPVTPGSAPQTTPPSVLSPQSPSLRFTIDTFDDPDTDKPTDYGRFSRHWQDEEAPRVRHQMTQVVDSYRSPYFFTTTTG